MTLSLQNLSIGYSGTAIAPPINATMGGGTLCCLLGGNGAGKSTLLRTIGCFQPALGGNIIMDDTDVSTLTARQLSRHIGVVLTERIDAQGLRVEEVVEMGRSPYTNFFGRMMPEDKRMVDEAIQAVGIHALRHRRMSTLSDGERQKVMIAKVLAQETPVVLMDEPTAFLDFPSKVDTMLLLRHLCHDLDKTILLSTHDLELALQTADMLWLMNKARELEQGTAQQLAQSGALARCFNTPNLQLDKESLTFHII